MKRTIDIMRQVRRLRAKGRKAHLIRAIWLGHTTDMSALWCANKSKDARFHLEVSVY